MALPLDTILMHPRHLIVKQEHAELAKIHFADTDVAITTYGKCHLGAALG